MKETYLWEENIKIKSFPKLNNNIETDVLIIGGGITGILCAYELKKRNIKYVLVEKDKIGNSTTKKTTAFITAQHEILYQDLIANFGKDVAKQYLDINLKAIKWYEELATKYSFDFRKCNSTLYSQRDTNVILKEKEALETLGYKATLIDKLPINLPINIGISFENQAQLHPLKLISEISKELFPFGGATGGGLTMMPQALIIIKDNKIQLMNIDKDNDILPKMFDTIKEIIKK